jgi:hypothetical protein
VRKGPQLYASKTAKRSCSQVYALQKRRLWDSKVRIRVLQAAILRLITSHVWVQVELALRPSGTVEEIAVERQLAVMMACWRDANAAARLRFLQAIGARG